MRKRTLVSFVAIALCLTLLSGCGGQQAAPAKPPEPKPATPQSILRLGMWSSPKTFNPLGSTDGYSTQVMELIFPMLIRWDKESKPAPYLAQRWEVSKDGKTWTFYLDPKAKWSDGKPVTAEDVKFSLMMWGNKAAGSIYMGRVTAIVGMKEYQDGTATEVKGIEVVDERTVKVTTVTPSAPFLNNVYYYIIPKHVFTGVAPADMAKHAFWQNPTVSAGPYKFVKYATDQYVELESNRDFFLGAPKIEKVILKIGTQETLLAQLEKGELDIAPIPPGDVARMKSISGIQVTMLPSSTQVLHVNLKKPYLQDKRVRKAMTMAVDREGIVKAVYSGAATVANGPFMAPAWVLNPDLIKYPFDVAKAKDLLKEAKWDGSKELMLRVPTGDKAREQMGAVIKAAFEAVGIKVKIELSDFATLTAKLKEGEYDLGFLGWGLGREPDMATMVYGSTDFPPTGWNVSFYKNATIDKLLQEGRETVELEQRAKIYKEFQKVLNDELPVLYLVTPQVAYGIRSNVKGVTPVPFVGWGNMGSLLWNVHELTVTN